SPIPSSPSVYPLSLPDALPIWPAMLFGGIESLGLSPESFAQLKALIEAPHGIVLATGPTGSGKTTSLYSALYELNTPDRNIVTVDRKSTRLNSSHVKKSYAVFC